MIVSLRSPRSPRSVVLTWSLQPPVSAPTTRKFAASGSARKIVVVGAAGSPGAAGNVVLAPGTTTPPAPSAVGGAAGSAASIVISLRCDSTHCPVANPAAVAKQAIAATMTVTKVSRCGQVRRSLEGAMSGDSVLPPERSSPGRDDDLRGGVSRGRRPGCRSAPSPTCTARQGWPGARNHRTAPDRAGSRTGACCRCGCRSGSRGSRCCRRRGPS